MVARSFGAAWDLRDLSVQWNYREVIDEQCNRVAMLMMMEARVGSRSRV